MKNKLPAAFFDLDGTLLTANTGNLWMKSERKAGRLSLWLMTQGAYYFFLYRLSALDIGTVMKKALRTVVGHEESDLRKKTHDWFRKDVVQYIADGAKKCIQSHQHAGRKTILLTSSSLYVSEIAKEILGLDDFLANQFQVENGCFTGNVLYPICYGPGKVEIAEKYALENNIDLNSSYYYSDSYTDMPMLERVGHPVAVMPDFRLKSAAQKRGWRILDWSY